MIELNEFFVEGGEQERSHVLLHITEPSTPAEENKGYFFAVCEINNGTVEQIEHLQQLIDDLESGYYETDDTDEKDAFELTLEYINRRGHHLLQARNSIVSCIVGALRGPALSLAYHGGPNATLLYERNGQLETMNILGDEEDGHDEQLFSAVIQGTLNQGDYFYTATPHVGDYITIDRVQKLLLSRPAQTSATHIQKVLAGLRNDLSFGGIIVHLPAKKDAPAQKITRHLKRRQAQKITTPAPKLEQETNYRPRHPEGRLSVLSLTFITLGRTLVAGSLGLYRLAKRIIILLSRGSIALFILASNKGGQREMVLRSWEQALAKKKQYLTALPLTSKILFALTFCLGLVFLGSLGYLRWKENRDAKWQQYRNEVQRIIDKKNAAEASLIYGDETKALTLLQEAKGLLSNLTDDARERKENKETLQQQINESLYRLRKLYTVQPELIADLSTVDGQAARLVEIDSQLIAYGNEVAAFYQIDPDTKKIASKQHETIPRLLAASTPKEQDKIVFLHKSNGITEYNKKSGTLITRNIDLAKDSILAALFVYNQRLYTVDTANNTIVKHNPTQTGYDRGKPWLKGDQAIDLKDAVSLAIDGDVFVLKANGELFKFVGGSKSDFTITGLDPALNKPTEIWTYNDVNNIYILEPTNKRVVVLNKNGKLIKQYTANEWQNPTGLIVEEQKGAVYVLDNNKLYKFSL